MAHLHGAAGVRHKMSPPVRLDRRAMASLPRLPILGVLAFLFVLQVSAIPCHAVDLVGLSQSAAVDQPQINMLVRNVNNGAAGDPQTANVLVGIDENFNPIYDTTINITAYLDTGSSGSLISTDTAMSYVDASGNGIPQSTFNNQQIMFTDIGIGGTANFNVSKPVAVQLASYTPDKNAILANANSSSFASYYYPQQISTQLEIGPSTDGDSSLTGDLSFDEINVVGMPVLAGKVMVVDAYHLNNSVPQLNSLLNDPNFVIDQQFFDNLSLRTYVYDRGTAFNSASVDTDPGIPTTNMHVKLTYADFSGFTTTTPSGAPGPTLAHNPFIGPNPLAAPGTDKTPGIRVTLKFPNSSSPGGLRTLAATGSFLFDTGAGASFISEKIAAELHVRYVLGTEDTDNPTLELYTPDPNYPNDPTHGTSLTTPLKQFQESVGGVGGSGVVAGFYLDSLIVPTMEANSNNWTDPRNLHFAGTRKADGTQDLLGPPVLVQNITATKGNQTITLDGDFGVNFLVSSIDLSGTGFDNLSFGAALPGAFDWITFDEASGTLGLQLNSAFHIAGDFNLDGKLTNADLQGLLGAFKNIAAFKLAHHLSDDDWIDLADVNRDGQVNMIDMSYLTSLLTGSKLYLAGDFNFDGKLTNADSQAMLIALKNISDFEAAHDLSDQAWEDLGDVNGDGRVDVADEIALMSELAGIGSGSGALESVPEPDAWLLAVIAAMFFAASRWGILFPTRPAQFSAVSAQPAMRRVKSR